MKKILVLISNYGTSQLTYCQNLINSLGIIEGYKFEIKVFSSSNDILANCENIMVTNYYSTDFPNCIYDYLRNNNYDDYDYILFSENDLLFTESNFNTYFKYVKSDDYTIGFLRYEEKNGDKYLIDCGYSESKFSIKNKIGIQEIYENILYRLDNCHQGCWFLKKEIVTILLKKISIGYTLEDKASNFFYSESFPGNTQGIKKYIPISDFENLLIHHQPNKYVNIYSDLPSITELIKERNENIICN